MAQTLGRAMRQIRDATDGIKRDIRNSTGDLEKDFRAARDGIKQSTDGFKGNIEDQAQELEKMAKKFNRTLYQEGKETVSSKRRPLTETLPNEEDGPVSIEEESVKKEAPNTTAEVNDPKAVPFDENAIEPEIIPEKETATGQTESQNPKRDKADKTTNENQDS